MSNLLLLGAGKVVAAGAPPDAVLAYQTTATNTSDTSPRTFSNQDIGTASAARWVIVGTVHRGGAVTISTLTIGGVSASHIASQVSGANDVEFWGANVPTGTTADIIVTHSGAGSIRTLIGVWTIENLESLVATDTLADDALSGNDLSGTIDVVAGGACIAIAMDGGSLNTFTWVGVTERFDATIESSTVASGASLGFAATQTGLTITATFSAVAGSTNPILLAIAMK